MSRPVQPAITDRASMTAIRGLLERNLLERAVALAETRWPGSGPVVELAHEWTVLSPSVRRERLASIGPEELARLRGVAQLQPDFARVMDDLEARGIIPPEDVQVVAAADVADAPVTPVAPERQSFDEAATDAALDYTEQGLQRLAASAQEVLPPQLEAAIAAAAGAAAVNATEAAIAHGVAAPMRPVSMPDLDLGLPSTGEFLENEAERRQEANELANNILERARSRVDAAANQLLSASAPAIPPLVAPVPAPPESVAEPPTDAVAPVRDRAVAAPRTTRATGRQSTRVDSPVDQVLRQRIEQERVIQFESGEAAPSEDELRSVAGAMSLDYVALRPAEIGMRSFFGRLVREGRGAVPLAGAFPLAVNRSSLVAVYGRLYPKTVERLLAGYCDIPGTQATVRVHADCRIVLLPEETPA